MEKFWRHAITMFIALRAGDFVNLAAGMWLVPKFIAPEDLGAILPLTTFATFFSIPAFAFGMTVMKSSADLVGTKRFGELKSLLCGAFAGIGILSVAALCVIAAAMPRFCASMRITNRTAAFFAIAAALLGSVAPVYTDALQAMKRFGALGIIEFATASFRFATLAALMPFTAFTGYFAGSTVQPLVRIASSLWILRRNLSAKSAAFWNRANSQGIAIRFVLVTTYLMVPMLCSLIEQSVIRGSLVPADSAGYYMVTRLTDILNYLTYPLLLVIFPYAADARRNGKSTVPIVGRCCTATIVAAAILTAVYMTFGNRIIALLPNGTQYSAYLHLAPMLLATSAATACQTFFTNSEVAAGRHSFLWWFVPLNAIYCAILPLAAKTGCTLDRLVSMFAIAAAIRLVCCAINAASVSRAASA